MNRDNLTATTGSVAIDEPEFVGRDMNEPGIGYIGPLATSAAIIRRLENARDWLAMKPTLGTAGQRKRYRPNDELIVQEIVIGCVNLLRQSPRDYSHWLARHKQSVHKSDRVAVRKLVALAISDVDSNPMPLRISWHFDQFAGGELAAAAKKSKACVCDHCDKTFYPDRKAKYCSQNCQHWAMRKRRKNSDIGGGNVSQAA